jgi:hypothetical protein
VNDKKFYEHILEIPLPWHPEQVELKLEIGQVVMV